ncbi:MAG: hypothetical protein KatS3mg042_1524 [Rhodothermaceae bacterium]|nr:MAG: hypothetical protein KatS3mg042_1524 [Rhodothermaceae bacterium]
MRVYEGAAYPTQRKPLQQQLEALLREATAPPVPGDIQAVIVPDANLTSGGHIAACVYKTLEHRSYDTVIVVAPSHTGRFQRLTICSVDTYQTPLGPIPVNDRVRNELCDEDDDIFLDDTGHFQVAGIDVQLPFLQLVLKSSFDIVPIVMGDETPELCHELGQAVGEVAYNRRTLVVACANILSASDEAMARFDEAFRTLDVSRLMTLLNSEQVQVEGRGPILVALLSALHRRANRAEIVGLQPPTDDAPGYLGAVIGRV